MTERLPIFVSNSEISTFKRCRRKWWLGTYRRLRPRVEKPTGALALGTRVHEALAAYYTPAPSSRNPLEVLAEQYDAAQYELTVASTTVNSDGEFTIDQALVKDLASERDLAFAMVEGYLEWIEETGADADIEVIAAESEVQVPIDCGGQEVVLRGKLDMRWRRLSDGAIGFADHKTCGAFANVTRQLTMNEQTLTYQVMERLLNVDEPTTSGFFNMLRKVKRTASAKPPFYMRELVHHNDTELRNFYQRLYGEIIEITRLRDMLDAGAPHHVVAYPTPDNSCSWQCEFAAVCPLFDDGSHAEGLLEQAYVEDDPYKRYNNKEATLE